MGSSQIVLVSTAGISVLNAGIFWREAKKKGFFHSVVAISNQVNSRLSMPSTNSLPLAIFAYLAT
jgi:hypothetical protein